MKTFLSKLYILGFMVLTVFFMHLIWKVTFAHLVEEYHFRKKAVNIVKLKTETDKKKGAVSFKKAILEGDKRIKHYLGYRVLEEERLEGDFHHIDFDFKPDKRSYCIECHGDLPHGKVKELRAFGNMQYDLLSGLKSKSI